MKSNEQKRVSLLEKVKTDSNKIEVRDVYEVFAGTTKLVIEKTNAAKNIKAHVTEEEFNRFLHSIVNSFLTSLYITASKDNEQRIKRMEEATNANSDLLIGFAISK